MIIILLLYQQHGHLETLVDACTGEPPPNESTIITVTVAAATVILTHGMANTLSYL